MNENKEINYSVLENFHETLLDEATEKFAKIHYGFSNGDHLITNGFTVDSKNDYLVTFNFYEVTQHDCPYSIELEYYIHDIPMAEIIDKSITMNNNEQAKALSIKDWLKQKGLAKDFFRSIEIADIESVMSTIDDFANHIEQSRIEGKSEHTPDVISHFTGLSYATEQPKVEGKTAEALPHFEQSVLNKTFEKSLKSEPNRPRECNQPKPVKSLDAKQFLKDKGIHPTEPIYWDLGHKTISLDELLEEYKKA